MHIERLVVAGGPWAHDLDVTCSRSFNLVIGHSGAGKTRVMKLLRRVIGRWTTGMQLPLESDRHADEPFVQVVGRAAPDGGRFWAETEGGPRRRGRGVIAYEGRHDRRVKQLWTRLERGDMPRLPLLAHATPDPRLPLPGSGEVERYPVPQAQGWRGALDLLVAPGQHDWYARPLDQVLPQQFVESVQRALCQGVAGVEGVRWNPRRGMEVLTGNRWIEVHSLPESYQTMLCLVGDLAWRAALLSGTVGEDASQTIKGIVLLEEFERYLDLNWQRRVAHDLKRAFPKVQFFATTHSPFVVQSMRAEEVINLDPRDSMEYWRQGIEDIAVVAMGADVRPVPRSRIYREFEALSERYMALIHRLDPDAPQLREVRSELNRLQEDLNSNPAVAAVLRAQRLAREATK